MNKEPAAIIAALTAFATAIIGLLVAFGIDITEDQRNAILATLAATCTIILLVGPVIRQFVFSKNTTEKLVDQAYRATPNVDAKPQVKL